jgi:SAM-dependent MidA family methyltransferase
MLAPRAPAPLSAAESARTDALAARIRARIAGCGGWMPFSAFMQAALYEPELGYYRSERPIFGAAGDFTTGPELSPLFASCLAHAVSGALAASEGDEIVEIGAGSGRMAEELFHALAERGAAPARYRIVEPSVSLAARQRERLAASPLTAAHLDRFEWLDAPPVRAWRGVAVANEVVDALPVDRFRIGREAVEALVVVTDGGAFRFEPRRADPALADAVAAIQARLPAPMPSGFVSEWRPGAAAWLGEAARAMTRGVIFVVDYGLPRAQYYHVARDGGTLCGFRGHRRVEDPFATPGAQDLTAWVDYSALADAGRGVGLEVAGFATQAHFLLEAGIEPELARLVATGTEAQRAAQRQAAATLLLPGEMGERFKVMALARGVAGPLAGFGFRDLSASL